MDLRQSTAGQVVTIGQALDSTDGNTEENGLTIANTDIKLNKHNTTTLVNKNSGGATNISNGVYHLTLDTTDTDTAGRLSLYVHVAGALAMKGEFNVLTATAFDAKYTGTYNNISPAQVNAECDTALADYDAPTNAEMNARTLASADYFDPATDTVANVTTVTTTANLTNLPSIPANWITAAGVAASALDGKGNWNIGKTGYALTQAFPTNFADMAITATTGQVIVGTNNDKTGYSIAGDVGITQVGADKVWLSASRTLTALPAMPANWITAVGIAAGALDNKGNWNVGKTGYSLSGEPNVNVAKINGVTVVGDGTGGNLWRA